MKPTWFKFDTITNVATQTEKARVSIYGEIGTGWDGSSGVDAKAFKDEWEKIPRNQEIDLHIHSPGGSVFDGLAIYNLIAAQRSRVTAHVDGVALSAASFIAMAAGKVVMPKTSRMMIHDAQGFSIGDSAHMREMAELLDRESDRIADIYATKTGRSRKEMRALMMATTWMDGAEAEEMGFCDECTDAAAVRNEFDLSRFRCVPGQGKPTDTTTANSGAETTNTTQMETQETKVANQATVITPPPTPAVAATPQNLVTIEELNQVKAQLKAEKEARITAKLDDIIASNPDISRDEWLPVVLNDESMLAKIAKFKPSTPEPVAFGRIVSVTDYRDKIKAQKPGWKRIDFMAENWKELIAAEASAMARFPRNANTTSSTIKTSMLNEVVTTVLQDQLAPFTAFGMDVSPDAYKPGATVVSKKVTAGGTVQTNATSFEDSTNFVSTATAVSVTVNRYTGGGSLTVDELNSGYRMKDWMVLKTAEFSNKLWDVVSALFTTANFTNTPFTAAAAAFSKDDLNTIWGMIQKAPVKGLVIDGNYFAKLLGANTQDFNTESGDVRTLRWPGWGTVGYSTRWSAAGTNVYGYAGAAQGVRIVAGMPLVSPNAGAAGAIMSTLVLPGLGISIPVTEWYSNATRTDWLTFDAAFGAAVDDATAGILIKSA